MTRIFIGRLSPSMIVALIALFVALGGTGYAALSVPKNSVGTKQLKKDAVTGKKIRKNAVTSAKVRDFSLLAKDFRVGEVPSGPQGPKGDKGDTGDQGAPGPTFGATQMGSAGEAVIDPAASPDESSASATSGGRRFDFTLPTGGQIFVRFFIPVWAVDCAGGGRFGLYLDGAPVPKSSRSLPAVGVSQARESVVVIPAAAGGHSLEARADCPGGSITGSNTNNVPSWSVILLGG